MILKITIYIKIIILTILIKTIIQIDKHKGKYIITACIPITIIIILYKFSSSQKCKKKIFLFAKCKNDKPGVKFMIK